jgi:hypothetical protein
MRPGHLSLLLLSASVALTLGYLQRRAAPPGQVEAAKRPTPPAVVNRLWVSGVAKGPRDMVTHLVLVDRMKQRMGGVAHLSAWRLVADRLRYRLTGDTLELESPQDQRKGRYKIRTWECGQEAPSPFDLCLELSQGREKVRFYSERAAGFSQPLWVGGEELAPCLGCVEGDVLGAFDAE